MKQRKTKAKALASGAGKVGMDYLKKGKVAAMMGAMALAKSMMNSGGGKSQERVLNEKTSRADVLMFSGCKDSQTSADAHIEGQATGAMSWALLKSLRANPMQSYAQVLGSTRDLLRAKYSQIPQLSSGKQIDVNQLMVL
jgi:hypothetical protein